MTEVKENTVDNVTKKDIEDLIGEVPSVKELEELNTQLEKTNKELKLIKSENDLLKLENQDLRNSDSDFRVNLKDGEILKSLCAFHSELKEIEKGSENPFFNSSYADFSAILKEIRPILSKHNLVLIQAALNGCPGIKVKTVLYHTNGESIEMDCVRFSPKNTADIQQLGGAITYLKRYSLQALLCISFTSEDADGEDVMGRTKPAAAKAKPKANRF